MELFKRNINILKFLAVFLGTYSVGVVLYRAYLNSFSHSIDYLTQFVAICSVTILSFIKTGFEIGYIDDFNIVINYNGELLARIIEGCNSISIIILFLSFVFSFYNGFKKTILFILFGAISIFLLNIIRIVLICLAMVMFPKYSHFFHDLAFPLIIYGFVVVLWLIWVRKSIKSVRR